jgi:hypothetical protein
VTLIVENSMRVLPPLDPPLELQEIAGLLDRGGEDVGEDVCIVQPDGGYLAVL